MKLETSAPSIKNDRRRTNEKVRMKEHGIHEITFTFKHMQKHFFESVVIVNIKMVSQF
jgi:hypothetical protein